jgi:hypothetical protein
MKQQMIDAVERGNTEVLRRLIERGADPNGLVWTTKRVSFGSFDQGDTVHVQVPVIELAAEARQGAVVRLLAAAGGTPGPSVREMYMTMLQKAIKTTDLQFVQSVIEEAELVGVPVEPIDLAKHDPAIFRSMLERKWRLHPESTTPESRRTELTACLLRAVGHLRHPLK